MSFSNSGVGVGVGAGVQNPDSGNTILSCLLVGTSSEVLTLFQGQSLYTIGIRASVLCVFIATLGASTWNALYRATV